MNASIAPQSVGDLRTTFPSSSTSAPLARRRRGRPRKYIDAVERREADALRKRISRTKASKKRRLAKERALRREVSQLSKAEGHFAKRYWWNKKAQEWEEYLVVVPTSEELHLTNKILAAMGEPVSNGEFLTDAPRGTGLIVSGGYDGEKVAFIRDKRKLDNEGTHRPSIDDDLSDEQIELADGGFAPLHSGRRVAPTGSGLHSHEDKKQGGKQRFTRDVEFSLWDAELFKFADEEDFSAEPDWTAEEKEEMKAAATVVSKPTCHCGAPASAVHPDDKGKKLADSRMVCVAHGN